MNNAGKGPIASRSGKVARVVAQSNHDSSCIPPELAEHAGQPLYILIALWCWKQQQWVDHKTISAVFGITERRASFQVSYLMQKNDRIHLQVRRVRAEGRPRIYREILVQHVDWP